MTIMNGIYYIFAVTEQYIKARTGMYIMIILIIIRRRFIKRRSSTEAEGKGAVHVFKVLAAIMRMFKKMCFEPRFKMSARMTHSSHNLGGCSTQWVLRQRTNSRQTLWKTAVLEVDFSLMIAAGCLLH